MSLPRPSSPRVLWADLRAFTRERSRIQWVAAFFAIVMPIVIVVGFYVDGKTNIMPGERLIYVESWPANRSDAEIIAQQKIDQKRKQEAQAERQRQYQQLEKRLGIE
jgi:hypothetical protein